MRCQRCGFELEAGQTFCSMCGTEQSRAVKKKKWFPKTILWIIKTVSKNHFKMWLNFLFTLAILIVVNLWFRPANKGLAISVVSLGVLLTGYELLYVLMGYKNPNTTKTKAYKIRLYTTFVCACLLLAASVFFDASGLTDAGHSLILKLRGDK